MKSHLHNRTGPVINVETLNKGDNQKTRMTYHVCVCAVVKNDQSRTAGGVQILTGNVKIPGANDFRTIETSCVGGIVDYGGCVDNIFSSAELGVDIAQGNFQSRQVTNIEQGIRALASCTRRRLESSLTGTGFN